MQLMQQTARAAARDADTYVLWWKAKALWEFLRLLENRDFFLVAGENRRMLHCGVVLLVQRMQDTSQTIRLCDTLAHSAKPRILRHIGNGGTDGILARVESSSPCPA